MGYKHFIDGEHEVIVFDDLAMKAALDYWTEERMKNAVPMDMNEIITDSGDASSEHSVNLKVERADVEKYPYNAGGKLYFTLNGIDGCGSAQFCGDSKLVLTAAHCVKDRKTGNYAENLLFRRAYKSVSYAQSIAIHSVALKAWWTTDENYYQWDYAFGVTRTACNVKTLNYKLSESEGTAISFGYPYNYYDGEYMVRTEGSYVKYATGQLIMRGNPMTQGCSGGAWIDSDNNVISVNSTTASGSSVQGPMFTDKFESLVAYAKKLID